MIDDPRLADELRAFYREEPVVRPNRARVTRAVLDEIHARPQDGRSGWRLPALRRGEATAPSATATDTHAYLPHPIQATNGKRATVIGRTQSMLSPVKAVTAGAIVFAIGGAFLIAQPFDQQGSGVPGAASGVAAAPAWVTATVQFSQNCDFGDTATEDGVTQERGMNCQGQTWTSDDPRLHGTSNAASNAVSFEVDGQGYSLVTSTIEVITDDGGWQCTNADRVVSPADTLFQTSRF